MSGNRKLINREDIAINSKNVHSYSPSIQKLIDLSVSYIPYVEEANRNGIPHVWYEGGSLYAYLWGLGVVPVLFVELYRYGGEKGIAFSEEEFQIPAETCAMSQAMIGDFYLKRDYTIKRVALSSVVCEPLLSGFEFVKKYGYDIFMVDGGYLPADPKRFERRKEFCAAEMKRLAEWATGTPIDKDKLRQEQIRFNRIQGKIREIVELRRHHNTYIKSVPMTLLFCGNGNYFGRPEEYEASLDGILAELKALKSGEYHGATAKLGWIGMRGGLNVMNAIDESGATVDLWYTAGYYSKDYNLELDPFDAAVDYVVGDRYYGGTTEDKCKAIEAMTEETGVRGLFLYTQMGCSMGQVEEELERMYFQKRGVASLTIAAAYEEGPASGQLDTRIKAFVEMLS